MTYEHPDEQPDPHLDGDSEQALPAIPSASESVRAQPANRTFFSAVLIIAFIFLFGLLSIIFVLFNGGFGPTQSAMAEDVAATNASVSMIATQTKVAEEGSPADKAAPTRTPQGFVPSPTLKSVFPSPVGVSDTPAAPLATATKTPAAVAQAATATQQPTSPPTATNTPVVAVVTGTVAATSPSLGSVARTATVSAFLTQSVQPTSTALPQTGFFDEGGLPGLVFLALGLLGVIFLTRRMRLSA